MSNFTTKIEDYINSLFEDPEIRALDSIDEFLNCNNINNLYEFVYTDVIGFLKLYIYVLIRENKIEDIDWYETICISDELVSFINTFTEFQELKITNDYLLMILKYNHKDKLLDLLMEKDAKKAKDNLNAFRKTAEKSFSLFLDFNINGYVENAVVLYKKLEDSKKNYDNLLNFMKNGGFEIILNVLTVYQASHVLSVVAREYNASNSENDNYRNPEKIKSWYKRNSEDSQKIQDELNKVPEFKRKNSKIINSRNKQLQAIDKVLSALKKEEIITDIQELIKGIKSDDIKIAILEEIYKHNKKFYEQTEATLEKMKKDLKIKLKLLLNNLGISKELIDIDDIRLVDIDTLITEIESFVKMNINEPEVIVHLIKISSPEIISQLSDYTEKGFLSKKDLLNNKEMFKVDNEQLKIYNQAISLLNSCDINPNVLKDSLEIILVGNEIFRRNILILKKYDLLSLLKNSKDKSFLLLEKLEEKIDIILELGYEKFLEEDIDILNNNQINRLQVLKAQNIIIESKEDFDNVISKDKRFFIPENKINKYIPKYVSYQKEKLIALEKDELEKYKNTSRTYLIGNTRISIEKVKRNLESGKGLYDSIFSGLIMLDDEYNTIINELTQNKKM